MPDLGDFEFICDNAFTRGKSKMLELQLNHSQDDFKAAELDMLDVLQCNLAFGLSIEHLRRFSTVLTDEIDGIHVGDLSSALFIIYSSTLLESISSSSRLWITTCALSNPRLLLQDR